MCFANAFLRIIENDSVIVCFYKTTCIRSHSGQLSARNNVLSNFYVCVLYKDHLSWEKSIE